MDTTSVPSSFGPLIAVTCVLALWLHGALAHRLRPWLTTLAVTATSAPTDLFAWTDSATRTPEPAPPAPKRSRSRRKKEGTQQVTDHSTPDGDTAVFEAPHSPPVGTPPIGDVTQTGEQPLFDQSPDPRDSLNVVVNVSFARLESGARAVRVLDGTGKVLLQLSAAQAHQLAVDVIEAADYVGIIRQKAGFSS